MSASLLSFHACHRIAGMRASWHALNVVLFLHRLDTLLLGGPGTSPCRPVQRAHARVFGTGQAVCRQAYVMMFSVVTSFTCDSLRAQSCLLLLNSFIPINLRAIAEAIQVPGCCHRAEGITAAALSQPRILAAHCRSIAERLHSCSCSAELEKTRR